MFDTLTGVIAFPGSVHVDLDAIARNVGVLCERAPNSRLMAVVKADAYGHGLVPCARAAVRGGASWLGVAQASEALALRAAGVDVPILTWLYGPADDLTSAVAAGIDLSVATPAELSQVGAAARAHGGVARIHLKIDTGLGRNGCPPGQWGDLVSDVARAEADGSVRVVGVWSHMAFADSPQHPSVVAQHEAFVEAVAEAKRRGVDPEHQHMANSAATLTSPTVHHTMVRPGLAVYGLSPVPDLHSSAELGLTPAMRVVVTLALVKDVPADQGVSYGLTYRTPAATKLGLVPMGYADGVPRHASNGALVRCGGDTHRIAGRVCMDQFMIDLGPESAAVAGDEVELFGADVVDGPTADQWADAAGTINYEIVTRIGPRLPRTYATSHPEDLHGA